MPRHHAGAGTDGRRSRLPLTRTAPLPTTAPAATLFRDKCRRPHLAFRLCRCCGKFPFINDHIYAPQARQKRRCARIHLLQGTGKHPGQQTIATVTARRGWYTPLANRFQPARLVKQRQPQLLYITRRLRQRRTIAAANHQPVAQSLDQQRALLRIKDNAFEQGILPYRFRNRDLRQPLQGCIRPPAAQQSRQPPCHRHNPARRQPASKRPALTKPDCQQ